MQNSVCLWQGDTEEKRANSEGVHKQLGLVALIAKLAIFTSLYFLLLVIRCGVTKTSCSLSLANLFLDELIAFL